MNAAAGLRPAQVVILAGICAALHVGKLPPAISALQHALGLTLVQAGFMLSLVQVAGMAVGVLFGVVADGLGARRSMALGLLLLAGASAAGGLATEVHALMLLRVIEGFGFLLVVLPAPGLVRRLVPATRINGMLGLWSAYMPLATAAALLAGPLCIASWSWQAWWWLLAALTALMAVALLRAVPPDTRDAPAATLDSAWSRLHSTLGTAGPWLVAVSFAMYAGQWLAVVGFLPTIYLQAGFSGGHTAVLTALVAGVNALGNMGAGRLMQRGVAPVRLLRMGFVAMGLTALAAFAGNDGTALPPAARFVAVLLFSGIGGMIPASLFALALRVAPGPGAVSTTVGWLQQWSAIGQFAAPPLVAWVASRAGGWQYTGWVGAVFSLAGLGLAALLARRLRT